MLARLGAEVGDDLDQPAPKVLNLRRQSGGKAGRRRCHAGHCRCHADSERAIQTIQTAGEPTRRPVRGVGCTAMHQIMQACMQCGRWVLDAYG